MRVVAGRWRGRRLTAPPGDATRPTADRIKEALFGILGEAAAAAPVVDLCCGAGGLGIEALSRGAASCDFVDLSPRALAAVAANLVRCGADAGAYRIWRRDAVDWLRREGGRQTPDTLVLADPPYAAPCVSAIWREIVVLATSGRLAVAVLEHGPQFAPAPAPAGWRVDTRRYGATHLSLLEPLR